MTKCKNMAVQVELSFGPHRFLFHQDKQKEGIPMQITIENTQPSEAEILSQIQKEFKEEFKTDWKEFEYYFKPVTETGYRDCIGRILLLWEEFVNYF